MSLYHSTLETPSVPLAVTIPVPVVRHVGVVKSGHPEARAAKTATIATAKNPARFPALLDESRPENAFSPHSLTRGRNLLTEGYRIGKWSRSARTGEAIYFVDTPKGHATHGWYVVTFRGGGAECECPKGGLGKRTSLCCHVAAICHWDGLFPGLIAATECDGLTIVTHWGDMGSRQVCLRDGVEVAK